MSVMELRLCIRRLRRAPGFVLAVILMLALGVGSATAAFSLAAAAWLHPLPYPHAGQLRNVWLWNPRYPSLYLGLDEPPDQVARAVPALAAVARYEAGQAVWRWQGRREQIGTALVSPEFFTMLGLRPARGRYFQVGDYGDGGVAVVAAALGGSLGSTVTCGGRSFTVIGIAPATLRFPSLLMPGRPVSTEVWLPDTAGNERLLAGSTLAQPSILARVRPGVRATILGSQLAALTRQLPASDRPGGIDVYGAWRLRSLPLAAEVAGAARAPLLVLWIATLLVWLIAVVNAAHLLLQRAYLRQDDWRLKVALGASRWTLAREALLEALVLALAAGGAGCALGYAIVAAMRAWAPLHWLPATTRFAWPAAAFALVASLAAGVLAAWLPARAASAGPARPLQAGTASRRGSARGVMLAAQLALATVLLASAALLLESFIHLARVRTGLDTSHVIAMMFMPPKGSNLNERLMQRLARVPGVTGVAMSSAPLLLNITFLEPPARAGAVTVRNWQHRAVTPNYFAVAGIPLLVGRTFTPADAAQRAMAIIVDRAFALAAWPAGESPIGRTVRLPSEHNMALRVIGVVGDARDNLLGVAAAPEIYTLLGDRGLPSSALLIRTRGNPAQNWPAWDRRIREQVWSVAGEVPVASLHPLSAQVGTARAGPRFRAGILTALAVLGLVLSVFGAYAVFAYAATRRGREVGIRMALGARPGQISAQFTGAAARIVLAAAALGVLGAWLAARLLRASLPGIHASNAVAIGAAALVLSAAALLASYLPARRAAGADPARALRHE